ncbi:thermonuclease family protein [Hoeflea sp. EC-HK425]|uniref:thermonuclease family protein n=1 Tax=Hoeflea sp. EC-HK425 TaxID=2038388 RepID=UPI001250F07D|nr:thermonuclease family protein [Hoeflea sp. EC-HK425]VVS99822.1 conserved hypothetical protein [Hoeflea sp. EC-HK425]
MITPASLFYWFVGAVAFLLAVVVLSVRPARSFEPHQITAPVRYVVDGDTLYLHGQKTRIRLFGIDAPEMDTRAGKAARAHLSKIAQGRKVTCQIIERDRYGRFVGRCHLPDGRDIGRVMIEAGHAREFCRYSKGIYGRCR